jgi:hypothetical protein
MKIKPTENLSPEQATEKIRSLARLENEYSATHAARKQELFNLLGDDDVEAVLKAKPELLSQAGADLIKLQSTMQMCDVALSGVRSRTRELGVIVADEVTRMATRIQELNTQNVELVKARVRAILAEHFVDGVQLNVAVIHSKQVQAEVLFVNNHSANYSVPTVNAEGGDGVALSPHATAARVISAYDGAAAVLAEVEAHTKELTKESK